MAAGTLTNAYVLVNGVDLSDHVKTVTIEDSRDQVDLTAMGATSKVVAKGLGDAKITLELFQDFAAAKVHATLQPLVASTTPITVEVRPTNAARSATNPAVTLSALMFTYPMLDASVGDVSMVSAEFVNASQTGMSYLTS